MQENSKIEAELRAELHDLRAELEALKTKQVRAEQVKVTSNATATLIKDIVARKEFEEELRFQSDILNNLFEGVCSFRSGDGKIFQVNIRWLEMFGYEKHEVLGQSIFDITTWHDAAGNEISGHIWDSLRAQKSWTGEVYQSRNDDIGFWADAKFTAFNHPLHGEIWVAVSHDISERKHIEERLREERNRLRAIIDIIPARIFVKDKSRKYVITNQAFAEFVGKSQAELATLTTYDLFPEEEARIYDQRDDQVLVDGKSLINTELQMNVGAGEVRWYLASKVPIRNIDNEITGLLSSSLDITDRKMVQKQFEDERNLLQTILDNTPVSIYMKDLGYRYVMSNNAYLKLLGIKRKDLLGKTNFDLYSQEIAEQILVTDQQIVATGEPLLDVVQVDIFEGEEKVVRTSKVPLRDAEGNIRGIVGITRDITHEQRAQQALQVERNLLNTVLNHLPLDVYVKDLAGRFILANDSTKQALRVENPEEYVGKLSSDFFPHAPEQAQVYMEDERRVMATGQAQLNQLQVGYDRDGQRRWNLTSRVPLRDSLGNITGLVGIGLDITQRRIAEEALAKERNLLRTIIDLANDMIYVTDVDGKYIVSNLAHTNAIAEGDHAKPVGRTKQQIFSKRVADELIAEEEQIIQDGIPIVNKEEFRVDVTGKNVWYLTTKLPLRNEDSEITGIVGYSRNITDRKLAEQTFLENSKLRIALEKEHELSELQTRFMTTLSHEFRTPLASLILNGEILGKHWDKLTDGQRQERLGQMLARAMALKNLLNDLGLGMQAEQGFLEYQPGYTNLLEICENNFILYRDESAETHNIQFSYSGELDKIWLDGRLMNLVVTNLLSNAIKYSPDGGVVTLDVHRQAEEVTIRIRDEGIGIPRKDQIRLFTTFFRAENVGAIRGTGLGLSIIKTIVDLHDGTVECQSEVDKGTTFTIELPIKDPHT